jgi:hypothetical protein
MSRRRLDLRIFTMRRMAPRRGYGDVPLPMRIGSVRRQRWARRILDTISAITEVIDGWPVDVGYRSHSRTNVAISVETFSPVW